MPVSCRICHKEFPNLISSTHLKTHNMSTADYKTRYGSDSLASPEYRQKRSLANKGKNNPNYGNRMSQESRQKISEKTQGRVPWNKGKQLEDTTTHKAAAALREERYRTGELKRKPHNCSQETRNKISQSIKKYAATHSDELKKRAAKSLETKKRKGYDLAFFRGRQHTKEAKEKMAAAARRANQNKTQNANAKSYDNAALAECTILQLEKNVVQLQCNKCDHIFTRTRQYLNATEKFSTDLCEVCYPRQHQYSAVEQEIAEYIESFGITIERNTRRHLSSKKEIDIFVPEKNLGIEVNGVYWHSQKVLESNGLSHLKDFEKYKDAQTNEITLITVYDMEWASKKEIVKSRLAGFLGFNKSIGARKCSIHEITSKRANTFLNQHHLQGSGRSNIRLGLYESDELVSVMTFSKENISRKISGWEINRFCHKTGITVAGGASKLFKYFIENYRPEEVISYSDNRWGDGLVYSNLNMEQVSVTPPNYWYFQPNDSKLRHRYALRKNQDDDQSLTEWQNRQQQGWNRIWDCGNTKWVWKRS